MPRSEAEERGNRQVIFRIRGGEHIEVITKVVMLTVGITTDVTVRLFVELFTFAVPDSYFWALAGTFFGFLCGSIDGSAVPGKGEVKRSNKPGLYRVV